MKVLIIASFLVSTSAFAQNIDLKTFKTLLSQRQAVLEKVYPGMTKKISTTTKFATELGPCEISEIKVQTVLKIEGDKIIVHSKENYFPATTPACAGFESQEVAVLFYEAKPSLAADLADLDETASQIKSISRAGEIVTMSINALIQNEDGSSGTEAVTVKYDLSKPTFKNLILTQDSTHTIVGADMADINVNMIDLKKVLFCDSADSDNCAEGDFSDILF